MNSNENTAEPTTRSVACYRLSRPHLILGIVSTTLFLAMDVGSVYAAYWNIDGSFLRPKLAALIFGIFWSCMTLLGLWLILAYFRERLFVSSDAITQQGCLTRKTIDVSNVIQIIWKRIPQGGRVIVRSHLAKIKIYLANFTGDERDDLVQYFHDTFAAEIQTGWSRFIESRQQTKPQSQQNTIRAYTMFSLIFFAFAGIFGYCWGVGLGQQWLVIGVVNALAGMWYLWRIRNRRRRAH